MSNEQDDSSMICNACNYRITSFTDRMQHYKTEWHRYNVKRRCAGLDSITSDAFELKLSALRTSKQTTVIKCQACSKTFKTTTSHDQHMQSNKHKKQQAKYEAALKAGVVMTDNQPATEEVEEVDVDEKQEDENMPQAETKRTLAAAPGDEVEVEDGDEEEEDEGEGIPLKQCLFCNEMFDELQQSLDHMLKDHGFFIPFSELLHDLEGLMLYLGEKVGIGHVCLYCNGRGRARFPNTRAVQQHMMSKDHCKIRFEDDPDDEEFLDFYDFPQDEEDTEDAADSNNAKADGSDAAEADAPKSAGRRKTNKVSGISEGGELILSNGTRIGHRSLNVYYKQNLRPTASTALVVPAEMSQAAQHAATDATGRRALQVIVAGGGKSQALLAMQDKYRVAALVKEHRATEVDRTRFVQRLQQRRMQIGVKANHFRFHLRAQINM